MLALFSYRNGCIVYYTSGANLGKILTALPIGVALRMGMVQSDA